MQATPVPEYPCAKCGVGWARPRQQWCRSCHAEWMRTCRAMKAARRGVSLYVAVERLLFWHGRV